MSSNLVVLIARYINLNMMIIFYVFNIIKSIVAIQTNVQQTIQNVVKSTKNKYETKIYGQIRQPVDQTVN
jgi:hypothetical protein